MKRWVQLGTVATALAMVAVFMLGASAFAKGPAQQAPAATVAQGYGMGAMVGKNVGGPQNSLVAVAAKVLNMSQADLVVELKSKTIAAVAQEKGVSTDTIVAAFLAPRMDALKSAVADGKVTQAQADQMLATMKTNVTEQLKNTWTPQGNGAGTGMGVGFVDANNDGICDNRS